MPVPSAVRNARKPKPNPRAGAGISSAIMACATALSAAMNIRAKNWNAANATNVGARPVTPLKTV